jgi:hypothetical protein
MDVKNTADSLALASPELQFPAGSSPTMPMTYSLETVEAAADNWDRVIRAYDTKLVFHEFAWLDYLEQCDHGQRVQLRIAAGSETIGYFCGMIIRKGPFRVFGSPLRGWWTPNMGPVADPGSFDTTAFLRAFDDYSRRNKIDFVELCCDWLDAAELQRAGFTAVPDVTHSLQLGGVEDLWSGMYKTTRNYVRRAEKSGLRVEIAQDDSAVFEYCDQLKAVFARKQQVPTHSRNRPLVMWRCLQPKGRMRILRALHGERCIATYLLVFDERVIWGLGTASWPDALELRPNELIHWRSIEMAAELGLRRYDFCGGGDYKKKYGAQEVPRIRWQKAYSVGAQVAYRVYEGAWSLRRTARQRLRSLVHKDPSEGR